MGRSLAWLLIVLGSFGTFYGVYFLFKYFGLGGDNSKSPYYIFVGLLAIGLGVWLLKKEK